MGERDHHDAIFAAVTGSDETPDDEASESVGDVPEFDGGPREPVPAPPPSHDALIVALAEEARGADVWRGAVEIDADL